MMGGDCFLSIFVFILISQRLVYLLLSLVIKPHKYKLLLINEFSELNLFRFNQ